MRYFTLSGLLALTLAVAAPAAYADDGLMGPPWPPPATITASDKPSAPAAPSDYPEDFSTPKTASIQTSVYSAFGEDDAEPLAPYKAPLETAPAKP